MVALEEGQAKLKEEEEAHHEKMTDLQKQMEAINLQAEILSLRRANLVTRRSSLEEMIETTIWERRGIEATKLTR